MQSLRKPTAGAWLLNQLVRQHGDEVQQVLDLGAQLRAAQGTLGADELRALDRQRRQLTRAVAEQARDLGREAGRRVTDATTADVEETLRSAMVDAAAGRRAVDRPADRHVQLDRHRARRPVAGRGAAHHPLPQPAATAPGRRTARSDAERPDPARQRLVAKAERLSRRPTRPSRPRAGTSGAGGRRGRAGQRRREQLEIGAGGGPPPAATTSTPQVAVGERGGGCRRARTTTGPQQDEASAVEAAARLGEELAALLGDGPR